MTTPDLSAMSREQLEAECRRLSDAVSLLRHLVSRALCAAALGLQAIAGPKEM
jgi:hypothetical protein